MIRLINNVVWFVLFLTFIVAFFHHWSNRDLIGLGVMTIIFTISISEERGR